MRGEKVQGSTLVEVAFEPCRQICADLIRGRRACSPDGAACLGNNKHSGVAGSQCIERSSDTARNTGEVQIQV